MTRRRDWWSVLFTLLFIGATASIAQEKQRWAFIGLWDRSLPQVDAACREAGVEAAIFKSSEFSKPATIESVAACSLVFVLNVSAEDSPALTSGLQKARETNPRQRALALDTRASQADLLKAQLLTVDDALIRYWRANGTTNIRRLVRYCVVRHAGQAGEIEPPMLIPEFGYYDPGQPEAFAAFDAYVSFKRGRGRWNDGAPTAVLIIQQSFWITGDLKVVNAQIAALEKRGLNVVVIFGDREAHVAALARAAKPDVLIEDRHGGMWESYAVLKELNVPYLRPISMLGATNEEWRADPRGLSHRDVGMFLSLQESWGTIEPVVVGGLVANVQGFRLHEPIPDRVEKFAARAARWAALRRKANSEKKLAIIYYNKSLGLDDLMRGSPTGAFLDGPESLMRFLPPLKGAGFGVENVPATSAELIARMKSGGRNLGPWAQADLEKLADQGSPALIPLSTYERWFREKLSETHRAAVIERFGPPPGRLMVVHRNGQPHLVIPRLDLGSVILTPQPERGEKQDEKLLHSRDVPPPHNYLAFYWWLEEEFRADAIVHWGTHGTLELLPGKEAGLSKDCWSDLCVGHLPVVDLWITDNLGEATLARRRSYAQLVDHMVPPALDADLKDAHRPLHDEIEKFNTLEAGLLREEFRKNITRQARETGLGDAIQATGSEPLPDLAIAKLDEHLHQLYEARAPLRLHVLGEPPRAEEMAPYLVEILGTRFLERLAVLDGGKVEPGKHRESERKRATEFLAAALDRATPPPAPLPAGLAKDVEFAREVRERLRGAGAEVTGLLKALSARYVEPGPGPEPIRNPASVPTGRNLYALNPEEIPTRAAWEVARKLVDQMLRERSPRKIGMDLNGMETMRDFGVMEAQILYLLGARPIWDRNQLVIDVELIPREELKRDRVDVFVAMGGHYKENFPTRVKLIDKAIRLASASPEETNPVRAGTASVREALLKRGFSSTRAGQFAAARIFGTKPGNMTGTNILYLVPRSGVWDKDDEIASVYVDNMNHVFTGETWGEKVEGLYEEAIQGTDTVLRVWASNMTSQLSNHHAYEYLGGLSLAVKKLTGRSPAALIADVRDPSGGRIRDFEEVLAANFQAELLNRKWIEGMKSHDYAGAGHMAELVKNTFGWSVTRPESVSQKTWNDIHAIYVEDRFKLGLNEWFEKVSPHAQQEMMATLLEAARKDMWKATPQQLEKLASRYAESVQKHGESGGLVGGGNARLVKFTGETLTTSTIPGGKELAANLKQAFDKASAAAAQHKVTGPKLEAQKTAQAEAAQPEVASAAPSRASNAQAQTAPAMPPWWRSWPAAAVAMFCALLLFGFFRRTGSA